MKKLAFILVLLLLFAVPGGAILADSWVNGYTKKNGTYVSGYWRSSPDGNPYNNWSYPGNTNPYTGKTATGNSSTYLKNYYGTSAGTYSSPSYSYSSTYDSCPANSYSDGMGSCKCNYGYIVSGGSCVYGNTYCHSKLGIMSGYNSLSKTCECDAGYVLNSSGTCSYKSNYYGTYSTGSEYSNSTCPTHSHSSLTGGCSCDAGYKVSKDKSSCQKQTKTDLNKLCKDSYGSRSESDGSVNSDGSTSCVCKSGYAWNEDKTKCIK
jgi:hypothetical protein